MDIEKAIVIKPPRGGTQMARLVIISNNGQGQIFSWRCQLRFDGQQQHTGKISNKVRKTFLSIQYPKINIPFVTFVILQEEIFQIWSYAKTCKCLVIVRRVTLGNQIIKMFVCKLMPIYSLPCRFLFV